VNEVFEVVIVIAGGIAAVVVLAIVVQIVDAVQAAKWRQIAAERRERWEARQLQHHGVGADADWDDD
jgi:hypothetical protein